MISKRPSKYQSSLTPLILDPIDSDPIDSDPIDSAM